MDNTSGTALRLISFGLLTSLTQAPTDTHAPDGGGARSLSQLKIMDTLIHRIRCDRYPNELDKVVLPCECFDLMGGSDTGAYVYNRDFVPFHLFK